MAARSALRVELALRAQDIPRAVHGTVAFFEAALWDLLGERASRHPSKRLFRFRVSPPKELVRERDEDRSRPFIFKEKTDGSDWYLIDDSEICAIRIAKHFLKCDSLVTLGQALAANIRELRNDVAHNEPTPALMGDARSCLRRAGLWSDKDTFLDQKLVRDVLVELGVLNPGRLLQDLLAELRRRIVTP
jgi:hypothetical protein